MSCKSICQLVAIVIVACIGKTNAVFAGGAPDDGTKTQVGFYNPVGVSDYIFDFPVSVISVINLPRLEFDLAMAREARHKLFLDLTSWVTESRPVDKFGPVKTKSGVYKKTLAPRSENKILQFLEAKRLEQRIDELSQALLAYADVVEGFFVVDEPYIHGLSKQDMESAAELIKRRTQLAGLHNIRLGVNFAGAMFNSAFANEVERAALAYAKEIDTVYRAKVPAHFLKEHMAWKKAIAKVRLSTYDSAGNMYIQGGLPVGYDLYGFDYYLSTLLNDANYNRSLSVLFKATKEPTCAGFQKPITEIKKKLTFYDAGVAGKKVNYLADKALLDKMYLCRNLAGLTLLEKEMEKIGATSAPFIVAETGGDAFSLDRTGKPFAAKTMNAVTAYAKDETARSGRLASLGRRLSYAYLFTYSKTYDPGARLTISGVEGNDALYRAALSVRDAFDPAMAVP